MIGRCDLQGKALLAMLDAAGIAGLTRNLSALWRPTAALRDLPGMASAFLAELAVAVAV